MPAGTRSPSDPGRKSSTSDSGRVSQVPRQRYSSGVTVTSSGKTHSRAGWVGALLGLALVGVLVGVIVFRALSDERSAAVGGTRVLDPPVSAAAPRAPDLTPPDTVLDQIDKSV